MRQRCIDCKWLWEHVYLCTQGTKVKPMSICGYRKYVDEKSKSRYNKCPNYSYNTQAKYRRKLKEIGNGTKNNL